MNHYIKVFIFLIFISSSVFAQQEALVPMRFNPSIKNYLRHHPEEFQQRVQSVIDTLALPFIDDFSKPGIYPDQSLWTDMAVFVNTDIARNPPTLGVATFDGADAYGNAYDPVNTFLQGSSDTLTSKPINLYNKPGGALYSVADSIYLSFFYEKQGWGDKPDTPDSLILEFFRNGQWVKQWFVKGGITGNQDTFFVKVNIPLLDTTYFKNDFRFRFRTFGSLSGAVDLWHLDYIILKEYGSGGFDNDIKELSIVNRNVSITYPFSSMPWKQLQNNQGTYIINTLDDHYKNLSQTETYFTNFSDKVLLEDFTAAFIDSAVNATVNPMADDHHVISTISVLNNLTSPDPDSAVFYSVHKLSRVLGPSNYVAPDNIRSNDSVVWRYEYNNYYSYDDGTSEIGYDLINSPNGQLAMRFDLVQPDSLRAVRMLFVQQNLNVSNYLFTLKIWSSLSPEVILYQQQNLKPVYTDSIDGMATYVIPPLPVSGTIYIGFKQSAADGLHLGFDRNTANNSKMFYNVSGSWTNVSVANGSFMIRAVMGGADLFLGLNEPNENISDVFVYPNPVSDFIQCNIADNASISNAELRDATGRIILSKKVNHQFNIDVRNLANGFYLLNFSDDKGQSLVTKKILISH